MYDKKGSGKPPDEMEIERKLTIDSIFRRRVSLPLNH
jgi:hypothetical protein